MSSFGLSTPRSVGSPGGSTCAATSKADRRQHSRASEKRSKALPAHETGRSRRSYEKRSEGTPKYIPCDDTSLGSRLQMSRLLDFDDESFDTPQQRCQGQRRHDTETAHSSKKQASLVSEMAEAAVNGTIAATLLLITPRQTEHCACCTPVWLAIATMVLLHTSSLAAVLLLLTVLTHTAAQIQQHEMKDQLPAQVVQQSTPTRPSRAKAESARARATSLPLPLPVKAMVSNFEAAEPGSHSARLYLPSPRGPAEVLLGLHRAAGTADAALEAAKAAVRGARQAADLAQAARGPPRPPVVPRSCASSVGTPPTPPTPDTPRTPRPRRALRVAAASPLGEERLRPERLGSSGDMRTPGRPPGPPRGALDVLLPSPRGPLQVLMERSGRTV